MYAFYTKISESIGRVTQVINVVDESMLPELEGAAKVVGGMPEYNPIQGLIPDLKIDLRDNYLFYDYSATETVENKLHRVNVEAENLRNADLDNKEAIASLFEMVLGGV